MESSAGDWRGFFYASHVTAGSAGAKLGHMTFPIAASTASFRYTDAERALITACGSGQRVLWSGFELLAAAVEDVENSKNDGIAESNPCG